MCDQANHDNCEIIDDMHLTITNLEMTIADLKVDITDDLKKLNDDTFDEVSFEVSKNIFLLQKKWEAK